MAASRPRKRIPVNILSLCFLLASVSAIEVTANSGCSNLCIDSAGGNISDIASSHTFTGDLSCNDSDYAGDNSTAKGRKFDSCVGCQQTSNAVDDLTDENDIYWFLFNLKGTVSYCVNGFFGSQQNPNRTVANNACGSACASIGPPLLDRLLQTNQTLQYNYCESNNNAFPNGVDQCTQCLRQTPNVQILANFVEALKTACDQKPAVGKTLSISTNVFSVTTTIASSATSSAMSSSTASASTGGPSTAQKSSSISGGVIAGIAVGGAAGIALIALALFLLLRRRKRGHYAQSTKSELDSIQPPPGYSTDYKELASPGAVAPAQTQHAPTELQDSSALAELPAIGYGYDGRTK